MNQASKIKLAKNLIALANELLNNKIKKIIYVAGVVINDNELKKLVESEYPNVYCHHMTIKFGNINELPDFIGEEINFIADSIFKDENGIAISGKVDDANIQNFMKVHGQKPHITICTANGIQPVYSNTLISNGQGTKINLNVKMKVGAFCIMENGSKEWIYE